MGRHLSEIQLIVCSALVLSALLLSSIPCTAQLASGGWSKFRANTSNTGLASGQGPQGDDLDWTYLTGGEIASSPAAAPNGMIYAVSRDQYLYALNPDGTMAWRYNIHTSSGSSSPAIGADGTVYAGSDNYMVYAVNPDGTLKWSQGLGTQIQSSPAIGADGTVYVGANNGRLYALDPTTGSVDWAYLTGNPIASSPALGSDGTIYFTSKDVYLYALNPDGTLKWRYATANRSESSPAIGSDGTIYFGSDDGKLYAVSSGGTLNWRYTIGSAIKSSPAIGPDGTVYVGADSGYLYAIRPDGTIKWSYATGGPVRSSAAVGSDGIIYFGSQDTYIYSLNPDGTLRWRRKTGGQVNSSPAISPGGQLYAGSGDRKLYAFKSDDTPPSTPIVTDDGAFSTSPDSLHAVWTANDPETGIAEYQYAIGTQPGSTDLLGWTSAGAVTEVTHAGLALSAGTVYYFSVKARNGAGMWSEIGTSDGIFVDCTPPTLPVVTDGGAFSTATDTLHASWTSSDPETGVTEYEYCIGTQSGLDDIIAWTSAGTSTEITRGGLSLDSGVTYYFGVKARNGVGLWSAVGASDGIVIDHTPPETPVVTDDGDFTSITDRLHASWTATDAQSGIAEYEYAVGTAPGGAEVIDWTPNGTATQVTVPGLSLEDGAKYYISVRARNAVGLWSDSGSSNGIALDLTPPSTPTVTDDGETTYSFDTLHAVWGSFDPQSGIAEYQYAIGTQAGAADVVGWTSTGSASQVTKTGLALTDGIPYYFAVKARNRAGLWSAVGVSDGISCAGASVWPKFRSDAANRGVSGYPGSKYGALLWQFPTFGWVESSPAFAGDGTVYIGSGDGTLYAIRRDGSLQWIFGTFGPIDSSPAIGRHGEIYFGSYDGSLYCLAPNGLLLWNYPTDNMVWSSPVIGPDDTVYFGSQDGHLYALRPDGMLRWRFDAGGAVWSSPALSDDGTIYFGSNDGHIYAVGTDTGSLKWRYRTSTAVDSSPSVAPDGTIYAGSGDGYFYALNPDGTLKWRFFTGLPTDSSAAIGPDGTVYVGAGHSWTYGVLYALNPNGTQKWMHEVGGEVKSSPAVSSDGTVYFGSGDGYVYALDTNGAVKWQFFTGAAVLSSPAIHRDGTVCVGSYNGSVYAFKDADVSDGTPPTKPVIIDEGAGTLSKTSLSASWSSTDPESGIAEYWYAIGTWPGTDDVVSWTQAGTSTSVTRNDLSLVEGKTYYFSVKAQNTARMWSQIGISDGIVAIGQEMPKRIGEAEALPDGSLVCAENKTAVGTYSDCFYIEEPDRSAGIKVLPNGLTMPSEASEVSLVGQMTTDNGEAAILLTTIEAANSVPMPKPIGIVARTACLGLPTDYRPGSPTPAGLETIGLLVTVRGRVTASAADCFYIDDNSGVTDPSGISGLKVRIQGLEPGRTITAPPTGIWVRVTGVLAVERTGTVYRHVIRPRTQADVTPL